MDNEFLYGCCGGFSGQLLCHPFDTIKNRYQYSNTLSLKNLYRGLPSPLLSVVLEKSILFGSYDFLRDNIQSPFLRGLSSGLLTTAVVVPFERLKIISQIANQSTLASFKEMTLKSLYRGWTPTLFREVPGYGIYFSVYEQFKSPHTNPIRSFGIGAACGASAWLMIYPSDPIKTLMQKDNVGIVHSIRKIYSTYGIRGFYRGFTFGIIRAALLHGGVFFGYETSKLYF